MCLNVWLAFFSLMGNARVYGLCVLLKPQFSK
jgi:hypothetical protein